MPNRRGFAPVIILIVILVIVLVAGAFYLGKQNGTVNYAPTPTIYTSPIPDPTANWKTITTKNWVFRVPPNLNYIECSSHDFVLVKSPTGKVGDLFDKDKVIECNFDQSEELISVYRGLDNSENTIIIPTNTDPKIDPVVSNKQIINVNGETATFQQETTSFGQGTGTRYKVYVHQSNYTNVITFNDITQKSLFDQILSTFKFQ